MLARMADQAARPKEYAEKSRRSSGGIRMFWDNVAGVYHAVSRRHLRADPRRSDGVAGDADSITENGQQEIPPKK